MADTDWYEVVEGMELLQGDILPRCPIVTVLDPISWPILPDAKFAVGVTTRDLVVMTQSCDLANDKSGEILLAQIISWSQTVRNESKQGNAFVQSIQFRRQLIAGNVPGLSLLHKHTAEPTLPWSAVNFHYLYSLPKPFLQAAASALGPRLRLLSPYREHLAQAFARYFMRVGLPHDARAFEKEGDVKP
jgi:hypothetical protein